MIWHEVTFIYNKDGSRDAYRSGTEVTEGFGYDNWDKPKSTRKYQKNKTIYTEFYPDERTAEQAIESFKEVNNE